MPSYSGDPSVGDKAFYAYIHAKPDGAPFYVGKGHGRRLNMFHKRNPHHKNVVAKYGKRNILIGKLDCSDEGTAFELEVGLIKCAKRMGAELTNLTDGGHGVSGLIVTPEQRAKISATLTGRKGWRWTEEAKAKVSAANRGKKRTPEQRAKMSVAAKKRKPFSEEHRASLRAAAYVFWERRKAMLKEKI